MSKPKFWGPEESEFNAILALQKQHRLTLEEFCGRFGLSKNDALYELKKHRISYGRILYDEELYYRVTGEREMPCVISNSEVERYAEIIAVENTVAVSLSTVSTKEKPAEYAARRREEGASDKQIAKELRAMDCYYSTIGRILQPEPSCGDSAYQKRGKKLVTS